MTAAQEVPRLSPQLLCRGYRVASSPLLGTLFWHFRFLVLGQVLLPLLDACWTNPLTDCWLARAAARNRFIRKRAVVGEKLCPFPVFAKLNSHPRNLPAHRKAVNWTGIGCWRPKAAQLIALVLHDLKELGEGIPAIRCRRDGVLEQSNFFLCLAELAGKVLYAKLKRLLKPHGVGVVREVVDSICQCRDVIALLASQSRSLICRGADLQREYCAEHSDCVATHLHLGCPQRLP